MIKYLASLAILSFLAVGFAPVGARGQAPPPPPNSSNGQQDNTSSDAQPGMARVSYIHGDVSSQRGDNAEWVAVTLNAPIAPGDRVATGQDARAELQLDSANILRMSGGATANITNLSRSGIQVQVGQGLVTYTVLNGSEANAEIDTPNASVHPQGPGEYRISVNSDSETVVIIRQGSAEVSTPQGSTNIDQGQMITVQGTDNPQYKTESAANRDDWDSWNDERNHRTTSAQSWRKTDRYYTGSEDLDTYGKWSEVPDYGPVWIPSGTGPDWAPYRDGRWVYEPYYGWTWVSYEPWGWAPYHYGRWFVYGGNWVWWPGPVAVYPAYYPVWSPAYVSFFGWGGGGFGVGVGFGFGFGHFGWLPCGPGDWYHPWFGRWGGRSTTVNIVNVNNFHEGFGPLAGERFRGHAFSNFDEASRNDRVRGGISSMAGSDFGRGAVPAHQQRMSAESFRQASMVTGKMPVAPSRESFSPSGRAASASTIRSANSSSRHFFTGGSRANGGFANSGGSRSFGSSENPIRGQSGFDGNRSGVNSTSSVQSSRPGWQKFTPPQSGGSNRSVGGFGANRNSMPNNSNRSTFGRLPQQPSPETSQGSQRENRNSWQQFTPPTRGSQPNSGRVWEQQGGSQHGFQPPASASRGGSSNSYNSYSRPPLNMRQPIVTPRGGSNNDRVYRGFGQPRGGSNVYNAPRGPYNAPSYNAPRGGYNPPRGGNAPRPNFSVPPRGGNNGGSRGGGGNSGGGHGGNHR
jgi:uncharacterized protein DUF6600